MISKVQICKLLLDVSRVPLIDTHTLKPIVNKKLLDDVEYLIFTNISNGIYFISIENLIIGKIQDKYKYLESKRIFLNRSDDMKELIEQQRNKRR